MIRRPTDRRSVLLAAGAAAVAAATRTAAAQTTDVYGAVRFAGGATIPTGQIKLYFDDPAVPDAAQRHLAETRIDSDGGSKSIAFTVLLPETVTNVTTVQIVARLERADGWLIARGSAQFAVGAPADVTLKQAIY